MRKMVRMMRLGVNRQGVKLDSSTARQTSTDLDTKYV